MVIGSPADVLVVEDDTDLNEIVCTFVEMTGHTFQPALDGRSAVQAFRAHRPRLVLLDLMLPDLDGFEVCRLLREDVATRDVPVVIVSAWSDESTRRRAAACGGREYLGKPFNPEDLMAAIRRHIEAVRDAN